MPPWCESILSLKVEAVHGKQVSLECTETSGGLWECGTTLEFLSSFLWKAPPLEPDREQAIAHAISISLPGDIILLAGKGHERYQLVAGQFLPFCERDIVTREALRADLLKR